MSAKTATTKPAEEQKKEFNLEQAFTFWINKSKAGKTYLSGRGKDGVKFIGFFTKEKQNPKEPDIEFYYHAENAEKKEAIFALWVNANNNGKKYASGKYEEKRLIGFFNSKATVDGVIPYLNVYFSEEAKPEEAKTEEPKQAEFEEIPSDSELPF